MVYNIYLPSDHHLWPEPGTGDVQQADKTLQTEPVLPSTAEPGRYCRVLLQAG